MHFRSVLIRGEMHLMVLGLNPVNDEACGYPHPHKQTKGLSRITFIGLDFFLGLVQTTMV